MDNKNVTVNDEPKQMAANTPVPSLNVTPINKTNAVPVNVAAQTAPIQSAQIVKNVNAQNSNTEQKIQAATVNIAVPTADPNKVVSQTDINKDGITDTTANQGQMIDQKKLDAVQNVKKSTFKFKISFGKKTMPLMLGVILGVILFFVGLAMGKDLFSTVTYSNTSSATANEATSARVSDGKNNITKAGNYKFTIPTTYYYDKSNKGVLVYDSSNTFRIFIRGQEGIYDDIANAKPSVKATLQNSGLNVVNIKESTINDIPYLIAETIDGTVNRLIAFTKASDTDIFYVEIVTSSNNYDYDALDLANDIIENAALEESGSTVENIDVDDIGNLVVAAAETYKSLLS